MTEIKANQNQEIKISEYKPVIYEIKYKGVYIEAQYMGCREYRLLYEGRIYRAESRKMGWLIYPDAPEELVEAFFKFMEV